jgi:hypothetical protein
LSVLTATSTVYPSPSATEQLVDLGTKATLSFPNDVTATLDCDFEEPWWGPFRLLPRMVDIRVKVECEDGEIELFNYILPTFYHWIRVLSGKGKAKQRVEKAYKFSDGSKGEEWWTTYRYQMEGFVDQVKGRTPRCWVSKKDSVENLEWIEKIYGKASSSFILFDYWRFLTHSADWPRKSTKVAICAFGLGYGFIPYISDNNVQAMIF